MIPDDFAILDQPAPVHGPAAVSVTDNLDPLTVDNDRLMRMLHLRRQKGMRPPPDGYGMELKVPDGRNHGIDGLQEALDLSVFTAAAALDQSRSIERRLRWEYLHSRALDLAQDIVELLDEENP